MVSTKTEDATESGKEEDAIEKFTKTYSFRKLPKGKVAKLQKQFEASNIPDIDSLPPIKQLKKQAPRYRSSKHIFRPESNGKNIDEKHSAGISIPIRSWEDASYSSTSQSSIQSHTRYYVLLKTNL